MKIFPQIAFNADGGGGQGGQQQQQQQDQQQQGGGQQQQQQQHPAWKAPQGLPDHVIGKDAAETLDRLMPLYSGLRSEIAGRGAVPQKADAYTLNFSDPARAVLNLQADDKVLPLLRNAMHKHGITDKQSGFVSDLVDSIVEAGLIPKPQDPNELWKAMAPANFKGDDTARIAEGQKAHKEATTYIDGLAKQQSWDKDMTTELQLLTGSAAGLRVIKQLMAGGVQRSAVTGGQGGQGAITKADLASRRQDPRNQYGNPKYDPAFAQQTQQMYKDFSGE